MLLAGRIYMKSISTADNLRINITIESSFKAIDHFIN